jgi:FtsZ-binding cell division protein ZapB
MDRLTGDFKGASMFATVEQARQYNRLRQYEDTGLTPDEIDELRDENDRLCAALKLAQARARDYEAEIERLRAENAAFKADIEAGRLVRLPYPIGTNAYAAERDGPLSGHVMQIEVRGYSESDWHGSRNAGKDRCFVICHNSYNDPYAKQLQDVFPTEEAARAALEGGQHE